MSRLASNIAKDTMCLLQFSARGSKVGSPASTPVNAVLGDAGFKEAFGRAPGPKDQEETRLRAHLPYVAKVLRGNIALGAMKEKRLKLLKAFEIYAERGALPVNVELPGVRSPVFIDSCGNSCAVAHLMQVSGHGALANAVNEHVHFATISEIVRGADSLSASKIDASAAKIAHELLVWAGKHRFSAEDLAAIQPGYNGAAVCFFTWLAYQPVFLLLNLIFSVACNLWAAQSPEVFSKLPYPYLVKVMVVGFLFLGAALMLVGAICIYAHREQQQLIAEGRMSFTRQAANPPFATPTTPNIVPTTQRAQQFGADWALLCINKHIVGWFFTFILPSLWVGSILTSLTQTFTLVLLWKLGLLPPFMKFFATLACISVVSTILGVLVMPCLEQLDFGPKKTIKEKTSSRAGAKCCSGEDCKGTGAEPFWVLIDENDPGQFYCEACWDDLEEESDEGNEVVPFQPQIRHLYTLLKPPLGNPASFNPQPISFKALVGNGSSFSTRFTNGSSFSNGTCFSTRFTNGSSFSHVSSFNNATMR